ncbi:hypothetical protein SEA_BIANCATRI92_81 [Mycobacterium phage BiancaTri92]|nr:hypothetical protein SEA_BIANCATRI92_81 [Mycobacterium phage BiancaTri92]
MVIRRTILASVLLALVSIGTIQVGPAPAHAEVSAECWAHLAKVDKQNTPAADRRYHLAHGEPSPCTEADANDEGSHHVRTDNDNRKDGDDKKSRYCRKHWFC